MCQGQGVCACVRVVHVRDACVRGRYTCVMRMSGCLHVCDACGRVRVYVHVSGWMHVRVSGVDVCACVRDGCMCMCIHIHMCTNVGMYAYVQ